MIFFFVINIFCYLLLCSMVFFPFRDRWYLDDVRNMADNEEENEEENNSPGKGGSNRESDGDSDEEESPSKNIDVKEILKGYPETLKVLDKDGNVTIFKKCFNLISAVDYLNIESDSVEGTTVADNGLKIPDNKFCGSMFEELLKCLAGKRRTDFFTWGDVLSGREDSIKILLNRGFSIDCTDREGDSLLHYACRTGAETTVRDLLEKGARIFENKKSESPLHVSASNSHIEITRILLENGAFINSADKLGYTPLHLAAKSTEEELVKIMLQHGANVGAKTHTNLQPIHFAVKNIDILKSLINEKADVNFSCNDGSTPLHFATRGNCYESIDLLLKNKALINTKDVNGSTPLLVQCKNFSFYSEDNLKCFECVKLLLDRGACVNITDYCGSSPLHFASENELVDIMELLLEFGANPNVVSEIGDSPLHIAVRNQSLEVVYTLLEWGADINVVGALGETPLDIASQSLLMFNVWNYSSEVLVKHIAKLTTAGVFLPLSDSFSNLSKKMSSEFLRRCSEEVYKLSVKSIVWPVTYLDILTTYEGNLTKYLRNAQIEELFRLGDYLTEFPLYSSLLTLRFRWGFERNYLLKKSFKLFRTATCHLPQLPFDCFENLCKYLSVMDLRNLAHASQCGSNGKDSGASCSICKGTVTLPKQKIAQPPGTRRFHLIKILNY